MKCLPIQFLKRFDINATENFISATGPCMGAPRTFSCFFYFVNENSYKKMPRHNRTRKETIALKCGQWSCLQIDISTSKRNSVINLCKKLARRICKLILACVSVVQIIQWLPTIKFKLLADEESSRQRPRLVAKHKCQIIYVLGVEGGLQREVTTVLDTLARQQRDRETNKPHRVLLRPKILRKVLTEQSTEGETTDISSFRDKSMIRQTVDRLCPDDGKTHVIIEDLDIMYRWIDREHRFRIRDKKKLSTMSMHELVESQDAMSYHHNLELFLEAYNPFAEIQFVALHRPFLDSLASHQNWYQDINLHSNLIGGFMIAVNNFLDSHTYDEVTGRRLWTLICLERLTSKHYNGNDEELNLAREDFLRHVVEFLSWDQSECKNCWSSWKEENEHYFDQNSVESNWMEILEGRREELATKWPSDRVRNENRNLQCVT